MNIDHHLLGKLSKDQFLKKYWQKKPLLVRQALPDFQDFLNKRKLFTLAKRPDIQSRLVQFQSKRWTLEFGPFKQRYLDTLNGHWTVLVQGLNYFLPEAAHLLQKFNFIPYARLDDLMASIAPDGCGVGPHFDSYDVFLLQGKGQRLWKISNQENRECIEGAPLKVLKNFTPEEEWILNPGDMLYLPPQYAHHGIAKGECITYSIGFRALSFEEISLEFLTFLQDRFKIQGIYSDPGLKLSHQPAEISSNMLKKIEKVIKKIKFSHSDIEKFVGSYLSAPKPNLIFHPPERPLNKNDFMKSGMKHGFVLDLKSQLLYIRHQFFMNGEIFFARGTMRIALQTLANERKLMPNAKTMQTIVDLCYEWYLDGALWINI